MAAGRLPVMSPTTSVSSLGTRRRYLQLVLAAEF